MEIDQIGRPAVNQNIRELIERTFSSRSFLEKVASPGVPEQLRTVLETWHTDLSRYEGFALSASRIQAALSSASDIHRAQLTAINHLKINEFLNLSLSPISDAIIMARGHMSQFLDSFQPPREMLEQLRRIVVPNDLERNLAAKIADAVAISETVRKSVEPLQLRAFAANFAFSNAQYRDLTQGIGDLVRRYEAIWEEIPRSPIAIHKFNHVLIEVPPLELYQATNLFKSFGGHVRPCQSEKAERSLDNATDSLEDRLIQLHPGLLSLYRGAKDVLNSSNPDRVRHFAVSLRELLTEVLHKLSPDETFENWNTNPSFVHDGKPTRKGRLRFICRFVDHGSFTAFVNSDLKATLHFLDLFQKGTHSLDASFSERQLAAMLKRAEGFISYILEIGMARDQ